MKVKVVDGSSLAVAVVLNSIPEGTSQVVLRGSLSKVANSIALALCQGEIQVYLTINLLHHFWFYLIQHNFQYIGCHVKQRRLQET